MDSKNIYDRIKFKDLGKYMNYNLQMPKFGYIQSNIRLVCSQVNMMRFNLEDSEVFNICKAIINYAELK